MSRFSTSKIRLAILFIVCLTSLQFFPALGQGLKHPLEFVPGDSVSFVARDITNWHLLPLFVDQSLRPVPVRPTKKELPLLMKRWGNLPFPNAVGGLDDEATDMQGLDAARITDLAARLFLLTGDARYADFIERAAFNALPGAIIMGETPMARAAAAASLMSASGMIYATDRNGIYVNIFQNCFARVHTKHLHFAIDQITQMPFIPTVKFRLTELPTKGKRFSLRLRLPDWLEEGLEVFVNGHATDYTVERGFAVLERTWLPLDEVWFELNLKPRFALQPDTTRVLIAGPLTYAFTSPPPPCDTAFVETTGADSLSGHRLLGVRFKAEGIDTLIQAQPFCDSRIAQRYARIRFK